MTKLAIGGRLAYLRGMGKKPLDLMKLREMVAQGASMTSIGQVLGCQKETVVRRLRTLGFDFSPRPMRCRRRATPPIDDAELRAEYAQGVSVLQMAKARGVQSKTIIRRLDDMGLPIRNRAEASALRFARLSAEEKNALSAAATAGRRAKARQVASNKAITEIPRPRPEDICSTDAPGLAGPPGGHRAASTAP